MSRSRKFLVNVSVLTRARILDLALFGLLALVGMEPLRAATWESRLWNPAKAPVDLSLPLPCGGVIAMRRVDTATEPNWLSDLSARMGASGTEVPYADFIWHTTLAGALAESNEASKRHFFIGIYEITRSQYRAVMEEECPQQDAELQEMLPADEVTWFDAVRFTHRLNQWILENDPQTLTDFGRQGAYVRLPSEAEWEFAARGGLAVVDEESRRAPMFPIEGPLEAYAHFRGEESCDGALQPVGQVKPNPLGLYDMVGNVRELVNDGFRLNANGRLHGQTGGHLARGGSCLTPYEQVSTAIREEISVVDAQRKRLFRPVFTGFRVAIGALTLPSLNRIDQVVRDFDSLATERDDVPANEPLQEILGRIDDEPTRQLVRELDAGYRAELSRRIEVGKRGVRAAVAAAALMIRAYRIDTDGIKRNDKMCDWDPKDPNYQLFEARCKLHQTYAARREITRSIYTELVFQLAETVQPQTLRDQMALALLPLNPSPNGPTFARLFVCQVEDYRQNAPPNVDRYFDQILTLDMRTCQ